MRLSDVLKWFRTKKPPKYFGKIHIVENVSEVPDEPRRDFFVVRREDKDLWAIFMCPCDQTHLLRINLSHQKWPFWKCTIKRGNISLSPSVWLDYGCKSHFWIHESRIYWAEK